MDQKTIDRIEFVWPELTGLIWDSPAHFAVEALNRIEAATREITSGHFEGEGSHLFYLMMDHALDHHLLHEAWGVARDQTLFQLGQLRREVVKSVPQYRYLVSRVA